MGVPLERDEGEYAYIAQQLLQGVLPYTESHSMKFPGIFLVYAIILTIFGQTSVAIHLSLLLVNLATAFLLFLLGRNVLNLSAGIVAGISFCVLSLSPALQGNWANSEHFVLLFAIGGVLLLRKVHDQPVQYLLSGFLLGFALLIKQHAIFFCLFGAIYLFYKVVVQQIKKPRLVIGLFAVGGMAPMILSALFYKITGNFSDFWFCTFQYPSEYISLVSMDQGFKNFKYFFGQILESNFPILLLALLGLASVGWRKDVRQEYIFLIGFFVCSFFAVTPGFYFRPHYFLLWMPAFSLFAGIGFESLRLSNIKKVISMGILTIILGVPILSKMHFFFILPVAELTRSVYGRNPFPESLEIAKYIRDHSEKDDSVAIFGSEPQILFYANRKSATRHIYMYPLGEQHSHASLMQKEMALEIQVSRPEFIVLVNIPTSWLFKKNSETLLLDWAKGYVPKWYDISGVVDIIPHKGTTYLWGEQLKEYSAQANRHLVIYKKRA